MLNEIDPINCPWENREQIIVDYSQSGMINFDETSPSLNLNNQLRKIYPSLTLNNHICDRLERRGVIIIDFPPRLSLVTQPMDSNPFYDFQRARRLTTNENNDNDNEDHINDTHNA